MAIGDALGVGVSGLLAAQRSLATAGQNIANVNTEGYSRQRTELVTRTPLYSGGGYIGTGVTQSTVKRLYDDFLTTQVRTSTGMYNQSENFYNLASRVDNMLADPQAGLTPSLQSFFSAVQGVATDPTSLAARQVLLAEAGTLTGRFRYLDQRLTDLRQGVNADIRSRITEINGLAQSIADVNKDIVLAPGRQSGQLPNDLLDKRDALLVKLSEQVAVTTVAQDDGSVNVFIGNGQSLVVGVRSQGLSPITNQFDATRVEVGYQAGTDIINISSQISGGKLGGAMEFRNQVLDNAQNVLGRIAVGVADNFNDQHRLGQDLNGALGGDFFSVPAMQVQPRLLNTGSGAVTAALADPNALTASDYRLTYDGGNVYSLLRLSDNQVTTINTGGAYPYTSAAVDGFALTITAGAAVNDSYLIKPTSQGAQTIGVAINDVKNIAVAAPIRSAAALANIGSARISSGVVNTLDPSLQNNVTIQFTSSGQFDVIDATNGTLATNVPYISGQAISFNGWTVNISGVAAAGDIFTIGTNTNGASDNRNGLLLGQLQAKYTLDGGSATYQDAYNQLVAEIGTRTNQADITRNAQKALQEQSIQARDAVSGVNLDEEAADMLRLQQAYQASAQVISISDGLFQALIGAIRR
ncbi:MAG: flagellar hook-associated protein FlgK [Gammaproteobacteria bacterium]|nr:flagellar hook-associated protein FlgK [Gammaproteobacteria bacterium]